jgi:hypothetical protein
MTLPAPAVLGPTFMSGSGNHHHVPGACKTISWAILLKQVRTVGKWYPLHRGCRGRICFNNGVKSLHTGGKERKRKDGCASLRFHICPTYGFTGPWDPIPVSLVHKAPLLPFTGQAFCRANRK